MNGDLHAKEVIKGCLTTNSCVSGSITSKSTISGTITVPQKTEHSLYDGIYEVDPRVTEIILDTKGKLLVDDITVNKIPLYETENEKGTTIYIGG